MKFAVVYTSVSGFTKRYAEWIAEDLGADIFPLRDFRRKMIRGYDVLIFGGSLHAVGINGIAFVRKNLDALQGKNVLVFATGASPDKPGIKEEIIQNNFPGNQAEGISFFYLRGGFDYSGLNPVNKILMSLLKMKIKCKPEHKRNADEVGMLKAFQKPADFTDRDAIRELVRAAENGDRGKIPEAPK